MITLKCSPAPFVTTTHFIWDIGVVSHSSCFFVALIFYVILGQLFMETDLRTTTNTSYSFRFKRECNFGILKQYFTFLV